ncbi:hypothetical protein HRF68_04475 [Pseudomonas stutzeri]|nr:hypothetical protein [Stutzerimonas stutzeri]
MKEKRPLLDRMLANLGWLLGALFAAPIRPKHWTWKTELAIAASFAAIVCIAVFYYFFSEKIW